MKKFEQTGSVQDRLRSGRPSVSKSCFNIANMKYANVCGTFYIFVFCHVLFDE